MQDFIQKKSKTQQIWTRLKRVMRFRFMKAQF